MSGISKETRIRIMIHWPLEMQFFRKITLGLIKRRNVRVQELLCAL